MTFCVENTNLSNQPVPSNFEELVRFVEFVKDNPNRIFVQISGYGPEVVEALAKHFGCNFFACNERGIDINPFTIIYVSENGYVGPVGINERSKIIIYARRSLHHHH